MGENCGKRWMGDLLDHELIGYLTYFALSLRYKAIVLLLGCVT